MADFERPDGGPVGWIRYWSRVQGEKKALRAPGSVSFTYEELYRRLLLVASWLSLNGARAKRPLLIFSSDELEARLLRWGANLCGAIDAVVDPRLSAEELKHRVLLLDPELIVTDSPEKFSESNRRTLRLPPELREGPGMEERSASSEEELPFENGNLLHDREARPVRILFTTGTTGKPRAVLQLQGQLDGVTEANIRVRELFHEDVLLSLLPSFHSAGSLFEDSMLKLGASLHLTDRKDPEGILAILNGEGVTLTTLVPSVILKILETPGGARSLNHLRLLNYAGEKIKRDLLKDLMEVFGGKLTRGYGLTEAGPLVAVLDDARHREGDLPSPSCTGRAAPGVDLKIHEPDESGVGELWVRSPYIMAGYWNDPEATEKKIRNGWLRTGDLAAEKGGLLHITGRKDDRIRSGGEWIHPAEIENIFQDHTRISEISVVGVEHSHWGERPVAFFTLREPVDREALVRALSASLSKFKWPDWFQPLRALPSTGPGKVDKVRLKAMAATGDYPDGDAIMIKGDGRGSSPFSPTSLFNTSKKNQME